MSASRERKKRVEQELQPVPATKKEKRKLSEGWIFAICIVLVLALVLGGISGWRAITRNRTVLTVNGTDVPVKEFNYFYSAAANSLSNYASSFGIETGKPLDEQKVSVNGASMAQLFGMDTEYLADKTNDGTVYDVTWAQFVAFSARKTAVQAHAIAQEAEKAGHQLDAEALAEIDAEIVTIQGYADQNGESVDALLKRVYGDGCDEENYRDYLELMHLAQEYPTSVEKTDDEIEAFYSEHKEENDVISAYVYRVTPSDFVEAAEDGTKPEATDEDNLEAAKAALAMSAEFDAANDKVTCLADRNKEAVTSATNEEIAEWLFTEADTETAKLFKDEETDTYRVVKLISKEDYKALNCLQIFISTENAANAEAVDAALEADASEESFLKQVAEYSEGSADGKIENATRAGLNNLSKDLLLWSLEARTAGDWIKAETQSGIVYLFYTGEGESYHKLSITAQLQSEWLETLTEAALATCNYSESAAMGGKVDVTFSNS